MTHRCNKSYFKISDSSDLLNVHCTDLLGKTTEKLKQTLTN